MKLKEKFLFTSTFFLSLVWINSRKRHKDPKCLTKLKQILEETPLIWRKKDAKKSKIYKGNNIWDEDRKIKDRKIKESE